MILDEAALRVRLGRLADQVINDFAGDRIPGPAGDGELVQMRKARVKPDVAGGIQHVDVDGTLFPRPHLVPQNGLHAYNSVTAFPCQALPTEIDHPVHEGLEGFPVHYVTGGDRRCLGGIVHDRLQVRLLNIEAGGQD